MGEGPKDLRWSLNLVYRGYKVINSKLQGIPRMPLCACVLVDSASDAPFLRVISQVTWTSQISDLSVPEALTYLLMAFFRYCCSHLVLGLMQTSLLFFSLALETRERSEWAGQSDNEGERGKKGGREEVNWAPQWETEEGRRGGGEK